MDELEVAPLVQIGDGDGGTKAALVLGLGLYLRGKTLGVKAREDRGRLCVVHAGHAVVELAGVVGLLAADAKHGEPVVLEHLPEDIAVGARGLHHGLHVEPAVAQPPEQSDDRGVL